MKPTLLSAMLISLSVANATAQWHKQTIDTTADFRGLCAVSDTVAWVSGTKGTFGRTTDGGKTWHVGTVPDAATLDFRDVEAISDTTAVLLSIGPGEQSRIYKTVDAGKTWQKQFQNTDPAAFYDAIAFWDESHGIAISDPVNGRFPLLVTEDGTTWKPLPVGDLPKANPKEGLFAASGTCLITQGENDVWFVTGGAGFGRVLHSTDRGKTWTAIEAPIYATSESRGGFSIAFKDKNHGVIVGGDYRKANDHVLAAAFTVDGGKTWKFAESNPLPFRSGVAWAKDHWVSVGTSGSHLSEDGSTWSRIDTANYNTVSFTKSGTGWAAGPKGHIAKYGQ